MSILLAEATKGIGTTLPTTQPVDTWASVLVLGWLVAAIAFAALLGAFRRRSISGPPRMDENESAWSIIFMVLLGTFLAASITGIIGRFFHADSDFKLMAQSAALEGLAFCLIIGFTIFSRSAGIERLGLRILQIPRGAMLGAATIFILYPLVLVVEQLTQLALQWTGLPAPAPHEVLQALSENHERRFLILAIVLVVIVAPMSEELIFRGSLQTALVRFFQWLQNRDEPAALSQSPNVRSRWMAVAITAALFAAVHGQVAFFPPLFVLAIGLGYLYERTGNLWATICAHSLFNAVQLLLFFQLS